MDALLINIPSGEDIQFGEPLGIQYVAAFSQAQGFDVEILDAAAHKLNNDQVASHVEKHDYKLVGISANFNARMPDVIKLTKLLRDRSVDCHITYGGIAASLLYRDILLSVKEVDSIIVGEGEYTFYRLLQSIKNGREWRGTPGIAYRNGEQIIYRITELIKNLDDLPFPRLVDYKQEPYDKYEVLFSSSRGCYASCKFCCINSFYRHTISKFQQQENPRLIGY
jgi:anaerobic magnesium-protoporphyrin IX monomethyl ester cyclase